MNRQFEKKIADASDQELVALARKIWPIVNFNITQRTAAIVYPEDIVTTGYAWNNRPAMTRGASIGVVKDLRLIEKMGTYHTTSSSFFTPTVAQVLVQIQEHVDAQAAHNIAICAFQLAPGHRKEAFQSFRLGKRRVVYQIGTASLFSGTLPKETLRRDIRCRGVLFSSQATPR